MFDTDSSPSGLPECDFIEQNLKHMEDYSDSKRQITLNQGQTSAEKSQYASVNYIADYA